MTKITVAQVIMVAKDRAVDDLRDLVGAGYWRLDAKGKRSARKMARLISMPDNDKNTLSALKRGGYVNGEEGAFYDLSPESRTRAASRSALRR